MKKKLLAYLWFQIKIIKNQNKTLKGIIHIHFLITKWDQIMKEKEKTKNYSN